MAIRKITDLPALDGSALYSDNFNDSYLEVSYETEKDAHQYDSMCVKIQDFADKVRRDIEAQSGDSPLTGDLIYNGGRIGDANDNVAELKFGKYVELITPDFILEKPGADGKTRQPLLEITGSGAELSAPLDMNGHVVKGLANPTANSDAVSLGYLNQKLQELSARLKQYVDDQAGQAGVMSFDSVYPVGSIYIDVNPPVTVDGVKYPSTYSQTSSICSTQKWQLVPGGYYLLTAKDAGQFSAGRIFSGGSITIDPKISYLGCDWNCNKPSPVVQRISGLSCSFDTPTMPAYCVNIWKRTS